MVIKQKKFRTFGKAYAFVDAIEALGYWTSLDVDDGMIIVQYSKSKGESNG